MSLSNPTLTNPARHFFEWGGSMGALAWYDKENQKKVQVKLPFEFIVLDQLNTISGYSKADESGIWANEVRDIVHDVLYTRTKKGPLEAKVYGELAQTTKKGGKYAKSIYIAHKGEGGKWMLGNFKAVGSAVSAWIEFTKHANIEKGKVVMTKGDQLEAQTGPYFPPAFKIEPWSDDEFKEAVELDKELQVYLSRYLTAPKVDDNAYGMDEPRQPQTATPSQQADFEARKAAAGMNANPDGIDQRPAEEVPIEDVTSITGLDPNEPINLDDIPF